MCDKADLPKRKATRLKHYDYSQNGYYYVTICTHNHQCLFGELFVGATLCGRPNNPDRMIEKWLLELENKFQEIKICDYVIMPNHIHFIISKTNERLIKTGDHTGAPLRDIVGWFKTMTTNEYIKGVKNNKYLPFDKKLWQKSYYDHIIRNEQDYLRIAEYIQNNPMNWETDSEYNPHYAESYSFHHIQDE